MGHKLRSPELHDLVEVTTRTFQERLLLRPSPELREIVLGVLGRAQSKYDMPLHACAFLSNHYHLLCSPSDPQHLASFMNFFNSKLAREVGRLHNWRGHVWDEPYHAIRVSEEPEAQIGRLKYLLSQGCKEGFVITPGDWPGVQCVSALLDGQPLHGIWFDRTKEYAARRRGLDCRPRDFATAETVVLAPLPCWRQLTASTRRELVSDLVHQVEQEAELLRRATGREPRGVAFILGQHPHGRPLRSKRSPAPLVHAASAAVRRAFLEAYRIFVAAYRAASQRVRLGDRHVAFPEGSFPPQLPFVRGPSPARTSS